MVCDCVDFTFTYINIKCRYTWRKKYILGITGDVIWRLVLSYVSTPFDVYVTYKFHALVHLYMSLSPLSCHNHVWLMFKNFNKRLKKFSAWVIISTVGALVLIIRRNPLYAPLSLERCLLWQQVPPSAAWMGNSSM